MECEEVQNHFADHLTGALLPDVAEEVAAHVRTCSVCAAELAGLDETWQALGTLPSGRPDSVAMRERFAAMLVGYREGAGAECVEAQDLRALRWRRPMQSAAWLVAAACLIIGIALGRQMVAAPTVDPQIASLREELRDMRVMVTLSLLQQPAASDRLKGVTWTRELDEPGNQVASALLDALMHDRSDNVRLAAVDALRRFADAEGVQQMTLQALPRQRSPMVQVALIDFVLDVYGRNAAPAVRELTMDPMVNEAVRTRAERRLAQLGA